jgi:hypothetical protein
MRRQNLTQGLSQQRHELLTKLYLVGTPTSRIRQYNVTTGPVGLLLSPPDICTNRADDSDNDLWLKRANRSGKANFALPPCLATVRHGHLVHRLAAEIHQITTERTKRIKKIGFREARDSGNKRFPDGAVKSRVCLIEKPPRSRRRLSHKKDFYTVRTVAASQSLPGARTLRAIIDNWFVACFIFSQTRHHRLPI